MESDLSDQFGKIIEILQKARISTYAVDGYEADDIIGTVSDAANKKGIFTYIVTGDRDMLQLVDDDTQVFMPIKGISEVSIMDAEKVREKYGIKPSQFIDLKALQGDASDNYPGVAGIGPKTAANLINEYGSVENIYKNLDAIATKNKKLADRLIEGHEACMIAYKLATIVRDIPFVFDLKASRMEEIQLDDFKNALIKEEFHTLPRRLDEIFGKDGKVTDKGKGQMKLL
jgi:DNA polymerase-1